jgi:hypothetical protein
MEPENAPPSNPGCCSVLKDWTSYQDLTKKIGMEFMCKFVFSALLQRLI